MICKKFIIDAQKKDFWQNGHSICFCGHVYPGLFFATLFARLHAQKLCEAPYKKILLDDIDYKTVCGLLSQSMLGMTSRYWIGDVSQDISEKKRKEFISYFVRYQGPHAIAFFLDSDEKIVPTESCTVVSLDQGIDAATALALFELFGLSCDERRLKIIKSVFQQNGESLSLDAACLLMNYLELLPTKNADQAVNYVMKILGTTPSLSLLAEAFFAKQAQKFFGLWSVLEKEYPDIFWMMFWSEQVWRACNVIKFLQEKNFVQAKRMSIRLPYSFINRDWQKSSVPELARAYQNLYSIDFAIKKGSSFTSLDLFYSNYFNGKFAAL